MPYDPFNLYGGSTPTATKGSRSSNFTGGTTKSNVGRIYDPFSIDSIPATPNPIKPVVVKPVSTPQPKQNQSVFNKIGSFLNNNVVKPTVDTAEKATNTVAAGTAGLVGLGTAAAQAATGNKAGAKRTLTGTQEETNSLLSKGVGGKGGYLTPQQAASSGGGVKSLKQNFIKPTAQAATDIAPLVVPLGKGAEGASLARRLLVGAGKNAAVGGVTTTANEAINGQLSKDNGGQIVKGLVQGAALGAGGELLHAGIKAAPKAVSSKAAQETLTNVKANKLLTTAAESKPKETVPAAAEGSTATITAPTSKAETPSLHDNLVKAEQNRTADAQQAVTEATTPPELPVSRPAEAIKADIQANVDHVKTLTGKTPQALVEKGEPIPKEIQPYINKHQELSKEYVQATSPASENVSPTAVESQPKTATQTKTVKSFESSTPKTAAETPTTPAESPAKSAESGTAKAAPAKNAESATSANTTPKTLTPSQTAHLPEIGGYTHSEHLAQDFADTLRGQDSGVKGGQMIPDGQGGYKRISEHSKFYRDYYKENRKAPTKAAYLDFAKKQLLNETDGIGAGKDYKTLLKREQQPLPTPTVKTSGVVGTGKTKTSKLASGVEAKAISAKLSKKFGDLPQYSEVNMPEQAKMAIDLMQNDIQKATDIALGKAEPPAHLLPESVYVAVENHALATDNIDLIKALANSSRVSEATAMGQRIRALGERNPESPVEAIKGVQNARKAAVEKRLKMSAPKAVNKEVQAIRAAKPRVTRETWSSFIDGLKC